MAVEDELFEQHSDEEMVDANDEDEESENVTGNGQYSSIGQDDANEEIEDDIEEDEVDENNGEDGAEEEGEEEEDDGEEEEGEEEEEEEEEEGEEDDGEEDDEEEEEDGEEGEVGEEDEEENDEGQQAKNHSSPLKPNKDNSSVSKTQNADSTSSGRLTKPHNQTKEESQASDVNHMEGMDPVSFRAKIMKQAKNAKSLDIVPSVAIPYSSECHALAFTDGPKWILTGGEDGFIRKYDFFASIEGRSPLTMAQKHNLVDSITKAGIICSYWENEQPMTKKELMSANPKIKASDFTSGTATYDPTINPVYALAAHRDGYWCLSGLSSGGISLYTLRYNEGVIQHYFRHSKNLDEVHSNKGHSATVSSLKLNKNQDSFLSGSWDKTIKYWDLNTGKCVQTFSKSSGQVSGIQYRPSGLADLSISILDSTGAQQEVHDNSDIDSLFGDDESERPDGVKKEEERKIEEEQDTSKSNPLFNKAKVVNKVVGNDFVFMSSSIDGTINIWDIRCSESSSPVLKLGVPEGTPPWCMSATWSNCGDYIYAGRRNSCVEEISLKMPFKSSTGSSINHSHTPLVSKVLQFPKISGPVSAVSTMPNNNFILCGSNDNIRLYDLTLHKDSKSNFTNSTKKAATPFMIIPGHHGGILSNLHVDDTGRFLVSASGNRGWGHSAYTESVLIYEIDFDTAEN